MSFFAARLRGQSVPPTKELPVAAAASFKKGALLLVNGSGQFAECGADPAAIAAVANSAYEADATGFSHLGRSEFPPGYMQGTKVQDEQEFVAKYVGTLPAADGGSYGVIRDTDGEWKVDFAETVATRVKLVGRRTTAPENIPRVIVSVLPANVQII
jgi:hypothetical protein